MATYQVETDQGTYQVETEDGPSSAESAGRAFVNNLPLGGQIGALGTEAMSDKPTDYSSSLQEWNQKAGEAKAAHPVAYGAGAVGGAVAPALIPGVGELGIAGNAMMGAAYGIGNTDLTKDPMNIAKQAGIGAAVGGAAGAVGEALAGKAPALEDMASNKAAKTLGLRSGMLGHLEPEEVTDIGNFAREADLVHGDTASRLAKATDLKNQVGAQIGDMGAGSLPSGDLTDFINPLHDKASELSNMYAPEAKTEMNWYLNGAKDIQQNGTTFDGLQKLKEYYGNKAFNADHEVVNQAAADVYGQIKGAMKSMISGAPEEYQQAMTGYKNLSDIETGLTRQLGQERAGMTGGGGGMLASQVRKLPGAMRAVVGPAAVTMGHPMLGIAAAIPELTSAANHSGILGTAAQALPKLSQMATNGSIDAVTSKLFNKIQTNPQSLGKFSAPLMQAAQSGGSQGLAATHFILANRYPEYNEMMLKDNNDETK